MEKKTYIPVFSYQTLFYLQSIFMCTNIDRIDITLFKTIIKNSESMFEKNCQKYNETMTSPSL